MQAPTPPPDPSAPGSVPVAPVVAVVPVVAVAAERPPPGSGGIENNKKMLGFLAGCGCLMLLVIVGVMVSMIFMRRAAVRELQSAPGPTGRGTEPAGGATPTSPTSTPPRANQAPARGGADVAPVAPDAQAAQYLLALGQSVLSAARGDYGDPRFGAPHASAIPSVAALGAEPVVQLVTVELGGSAGSSQHIRTVMIAFADGRLRAAEARLGSRPSGGAFAAAASPELFALVDVVGDGLLQRGECPRLLAPSELEELPQPLRGERTRALGESRIECQGLRPWPGFQDAWAPHVGVLLVLADGASGPVLIEAQLLTQRGVLTPTRIRERPRR